MSTSTQPAALPVILASAELLVLMIPSPLIAILSFILSKPIGSTSLYLIPAAFFLTSIHHAVVRFVVAWRSRATTHNNMPIEKRYEPLSHMANVCFEGLLAALWLAGGAISIFVNISEWKKSSPQDVASAGLAILEAGLVTAITVYTWKLRKAVRVYRMVPTVVVLSSNAESSSLIGKPNTMV